MRFLRAEGIQTVGFVLDYGWVCLPVPSVPPVCAESGRDGIVTGQGVVKSCQPEIFIDRPGGITEVQGGAGGQAVLKQLRSIGFRPVTEKRQNARHEIWCCDIGAPVRASRCRVCWISKVARN